MAHLIRAGRHQRPMLAMFTRYHLGSKDKYDRGIWVTDKDIETALAMMPSDPTYRYFGQGPCFCVDGTNIHNHVFDYELTALKST